MSYSHNLSDEKKEKRRGWRERNEILSEISGKTIQTDVFTQYLYLWSKFEFLLSARIAYLSPQYKFWFYFFFHLNHRTIIIVNGIYRLWQIIMIIHYNSDTLFDAGTSTSPIW